jgi:signal peptidase
MGWLESPCADMLACRFLPYVGMVTIIMNDYPMLKYGLIAVLAVLVITSKE